MRWMLSIAVAAAAAAMLVAGGAARPQVVPQPGTWTGKTWQGKPVSLQVSADGKSWRKFHATMVLYCEGTHKRNFDFNVWFSTATWQPVKDLSSSFTSTMSRTWKGTSTDGHALSMSVSGTFHYTRTVGSTRVSRYVHGLLNVFVRHPSWGLCYLHHASDMSGWEARPSG